MERLIHLVQCLKPGEVQFIVDFYNFRSKKNYSKRLQLFNLILKNKAKTNQQAASCIYHHSPNSTFCHLKKSLKDDILNFLLLTSKYEWEQGPLRQEIISRKMLLQSKVLLYRGVVEEGLDLARKASGIAERYEFPDIKLVADDLLRKYCPPINHGKYDRLINQSIVHLHNLYQSKKGHFDPDSILSSSSIGQIKAKPAKVYASGSKKAWFWQKISLINQLFKQKRLLDAKHNTLELLDFLKQEKTVDTSNKRSQTQLCLARVLMHLQEYKEAARVAEQAAKNCPNLPKEQMLTLEVLFFAHLRIGNFYKAHADYLQAQRLCTVDPVSSCKWTLMYAALRFLQKEFSKVNKVLNNRGNANKSTRLWILGYRLLGLLTTLELQDYDWYEYRLESLRKQLRSLQGVTNMRLKLIFNLLSGITKNNYDYCTLVDKERDTFDCLTCQDNATNWDPLGIEVVNIPQWIISKSVAQN